MITARDLTKRYGDTTAVNGLSFDIKPGVVTGFLGPNGAGKSTTMRLILGLDRPDAGRALIDGQPYRALHKPLYTVGALLDAKWMHPNRSARAHLRWLARSNEIPRRRVDEVLDLVGLASVADRRAGGFSLGMSQRLGIAAALLGDPRVLLFDEPVNGLDPEGILWIRKFMHGLAEQGRTILVSSHLLSEMALTAQDLVVIGRGRLISQSSTADFIARAGDAATRVRSPQQTDLAAALTEVGADVREDEQGLLVSGLDAAAIGELAAARGSVLHELSPRSGSLEEAFMRLTGEAVEFRTHEPADQSNQPGAEQPAS